MTINEIKAILPLASTCNVDASIKYAKRETVICTVKKVYKSGLNIYLVLESGRQLVSRKIKGIELI